MIAEIVGRLSFIQPEKRIPCFSILRSRVGRFWGHSQTSGCARGNCVVVVVMGGGDGRAEKGPKEYKGLRWMTTKTMTTTKKTTTTTTINVARGVRVDKWTSGRPGAGVHLLFKGVYHQWIWKKGKKYRRNGRLAKEIMTRIIAMIKYTNVYLRETKLHAHNQFYWNSVLPNKVRQKLWRCLCTHSHGAPHSRFRGNECINWVIVVRLCRRRIWRPYIKGLTKFDDERR